MNETRDTGQPDAYTEHRAPRGARIDILLPLSLIIPLIVYYNTLCPVIFFGDSGELVTAAKVGGLAFPTGYPAFLISLAIFIRLPLQWLAPAVQTIDPLAWQANLLSAVYGASACLVLYMLLCRMTRLPIVAFAAALCLAFGRTLWQQSLIAEVYSLNILLIVSILYFDFRVWEEKKGRYVVLRWLLQALALANHPTSLFFIPFGIYITLLYLIKSRERKKMRHIGYAILAFILGISLYLYLPIASMFNPPLDWENPETLRNFWGVVSRATYSTGFSQWQWGSEGLSSIGLAKAYWQWSFQNLGPALLSLAAIGVIAAFRHRDGNRGYRIGLLITHILLLSFFWTYYIGVNEYDLQFMEVYYIANHLIILMFAVWGFLWLVPLIIPSARRFPVRYNLGTGTFLLIIALAIYLMNFPHADRSRNLIAHYYLDDIAATLPDEGSNILITSGDDIFLTWYWKYAKGELPNTLLIGKHTFFAQESWFWDWIKRENPDLAIPDIERIAADAKGDRGMAEKMFIARLYRMNEAGYNMFFTRFTPEVNPEIVDQSIVPYQRGLLVQLVDNGKQGEGLYLEEELLAEYNLDAILNLDPATFDFYEKDLFGRYSIPLYSYGLFFASKGDIPRSLEFFTLASHFVTGVDNRDFQAQVNNEFGLAYLRSAKNEKDPALKAQYYLRAKEIYLKLSKEYPDKAIYHSHLARLYYLEGDIDTARREAYRALELEPGNQLIQQLVDGIEGRESTDDTYIYE